MVGRRFGKLTVIKKAEPNKWGGEKCYAVGN